MEATPDNRPSIQDLIRVTEANRASKNTLARDLAGSHAVIVLRSEGPDRRGVVISKAPDGPGWRVSYFVADGFSGHTNRLTAYDAIMLALDERYTISEPNLLREMSATLRFRQGCEKTYSLNAAPTP